MSLAKKGKPIHPNSLAAVKRPKTEEARANMRAVWVIRKQNKLKGLLECKPL